MNRKIEWLITIVDRGRGDKVAEVYQRHHVAVQLVTHGRHCHIQNYGCAGPG